MGITFFIKCLRIMMSIHFSHLAHENLPYKPAKLIKTDDNVIVIINHKSISTNSVNS